MDQKKEIAQQTIIEDEPKISLAEKLKKKKKHQRKKFIKRSLLAIILLFFSYSTWFLFKPFKASAEYGICHTLLELHITYPYSLYVSEMKIKRDGAMKLWYTHTDAFGGYRMEPFICRVEFFPDPNTNVNLPRVTELKFNKVTVGPEQLAFLNNAMPYFVAFPLVKNYPVPLPDSLADLQFDPESYRKIKIDPEKKSH
ncbi:MAG: hypothetical protein KAJ29_00015 [Alphaproteobacteria bacterium]|nr:hypothetical protein [Alphaproteobacteria bacterium]